MGWVDGCVEWVCKKRVGVVLVVPIPGGVIQAIQFPTIFIQESVFNLKLVEIRKWRQSGEVRSSSRLRRSIINEPASSRRVFLFQIAPMLILSAVGKTKSARFQISKLIIEG